MIVTVFFLEGTCPYRYYNANKRYYDVEGFDNGTMSFTVKKSPRNKTFSKNVIHHVEYGEDDPKENVIYD